MDYCALATARSIPIAQEIATRFDELKLEHDIGQLKIKISGCINACGHHHVGHIGILGLDRAGVENYQITLGGDGTETTTIGERAGPGFSADDIVPAIERLVPAYLSPAPGRDETFLQAYRRLGHGALQSHSLPTRGQSKCRLRNLSNAATSCTAKATRQTCCAMRWTDVQLGKIALVSSFGAESVVLLHMLSEIDKDAPVLFLDTDMLFAETLAYQREVAEHLGLRDVRVITPNRECRADRRCRRPAASSRHRRLLRSAQDRAPWRSAAGFDGWITGRKRFQGGSRATLDSSRKTGARSRSTRWPIGMLQI